MSNFYIQEDGESKGPFTIDQLTELWKTGAVNAETPHRQKDDFEWTPLGIRKSIFEQTGIPSALMPKTRLCKKCGTRILENASACQRCGTKTARGKSDTYLGIGIVLFLIFFFFKACSK